MKLKSIVLALLGGLAALGGWGVAQGDEAGPGSLEARWQEAQNSGNLAAVADLFTEDAWFSPFDGSTLKGIGAIRAFFTSEGGSPTGGPRIEISPEEHTVVGELAYGYGTYTLSAPDGSQIATGNYLGMYKKEGGEWRIHRYMGNAAMPAGVQEGAPAGETLSSAELGEHFVAIFNKGDPSIADEIFSTNFVAHVTGSPTTLDREGWKAYLEGFRASFPDLRLDVKDMVATDDMVVLRVALRGTQTGPFQDLPPSGKEVAFEGVAIHRIENGQIVEHWGVMDLLSLTQQLSGSPEGAQEVTSVETAAANRTEANKALVRQMIKSGSGQVKTEEALREHVPSEALIEHVKVLEAAFPRYEVSIDDIIAEGDKVVVRARAKGRHEGEFAGIAPTGRQMETPFIAIYRLEEGKIAEFWIQADMMGLVQQLTGPEATHGRSDGER